MFNPTLPYELSGFGITELSPCKMKQSASHPGTLHVLSNQTKEKPSVREETQDTEEERIAVAAVYRQAEHRQRDLESD